MNVAFVTTSYPAYPDDPSGHFVRAEAEARALGGDEVTVITPGHARISAEGRIRVVRIGCERAYGWPGAATRLEANPALLTEAISFVPRARRAAAAVRPDVCVAHWALPSALVVPRACALEIVSHGADVRLLAALPAPLRDAWVERVAARSTTWQFASDALYTRLSAAVSPRAALALARKARVSAPRIEVARPDEAAVRKLRARAAGSPLYAVVGRLVRDKRVDHVVRHVHRAQEERAALAVVGDGPERARLEAEARALGVRALFVGTVGRSEALSWIAAADALLFASRAEGLSTVLREAHALGVPVVHV